MTRKKSTAILEGNGPVPQDKSGLSGLAMKEIHRGQIFYEELDKWLDKWTSYFDVRLEDTKEKNTDQRLAGLE